MGGNPRTAVATLRQRLQDGERGGSDTDREALLAFSDQLKLLRETYGWHRHNKLLRHCIRISEETDTGVDIATARTDREVAETILRWIHDTYDLDETPETNQNYRVALRMFGKRTTGNGEVPDALEWIPTTLPSSYDPTPDPSAMLRWSDDIRPMIDACKNTRDAAAIALQFDAGLRGGELEALTVGQVSETDHGLQVFVDGKTGQRPVDLVPSTPYVTRWLADHPTRDPEAPLWSHLDSPTSLSYQAYMKMFKLPARRAGVEKPVTPTAFRKSNASWLARKGANAALIEDRQGRVRGSEWVARYVARFGEDAQRQYAALHGLDVEPDEAEEITPLTCPRCDKQTPRDEPFCVWCNQALDHGAASDIRQKQSDQQFALLQFVKDNPEFLSRVEEMTDLIELVDANPALVEEARRHAADVEGD